MSRRTVVRRYLAVATLLVVFPLVTGAGCNNKNNCPDETEAAMSVAFKPTCKPTNGGPQWVDPIPTAEP
jgi:hypothetical protein